MIILQTIADEINADRNTSWYGSVSYEDIKEVTVRRGCAEIEVRFKKNGDMGYATIDAAPVLTELLREVAFKNNDD